jgi:hypothetical protein
LVIEVELKLCRSSEQLGGCIIAQAPADAVSLKDYLRRD